MYLVQICLALVLSGLTALAAAPALADDCGHYARRAVMQAQENIKRGCGYSGPRWSTDRNGHYDWCKSVPKAEADRQVGIRERELQKCRQGRKGFQAGEGCDEYARVAVEQNEENNREGCGYRGPAWISDYAGHRKWCLSVSLEEAQRQNDKRRRALDRCRNSGPQRGSSACEEYARTAVKQMEENLNRGCGFRGPLWTRDFEGHRRWCNGVSREEARRQTAARAWELNRCRK